MGKVFVCSISFVLANFLCEWLHAVPDYNAASLASWNQFVAIAIFYFIWIRPNEFDVK
jgi:hypothetical protein